MMTVAETSSIIGAALLLLAACTAVGALLVLPFKKLITGTAPAAEASNSARPSDSGAGLVMNWLVWPTYAVFALTAYLGEMHTLFANAGFGYVYITLGIPAFLLDWLILVIYASLQPVRSRWLFCALGAAGLLALGYANIN